MAEERIMSVGFPVEDSEFLYILRSRLHMLLNLTRNPEMFPGAQPVSFERKHLDWLERDDYYVCEKSDGIRFLLYYAVPPTGPTAFLIDRNYEFKALPELTLPTRDLKGIQEETLLDGELVYDGAQDCLIFYIFDALMFQARSITQQPLPARLQVIQNDVIAPLKARMKASGEPYPFQLRLKQMWKPYGLRELFERIIPTQGHENDGLIFTPVQDPYLAGTCHRLLKWKPSEMNSIDFMIVAKAKNQFELHMATNGVPHFYCTFDPTADEALKEHVSADLNGKIAEFRYAGEDSWKFMRFRADKKLPNDIKTVQKVMQSIQDNITCVDLLEREGTMRKNWKAREAQPVTEEPLINLQPRSQLKYPMKLSKLEEPEFAWIKETKKRKLEAESDGEASTPAANEVDRKFASNQDLNYDLSESD